MTPEQEQKLQVYLESFDGDWGLYTNGIAAARGCSQETAALLLVGMQMGAVRDVIRDWHEFQRASQHPEPKPDCPHCVEAKRVLDIQTKYMELATKFLETHQRDDDSDKPWLVP